MEHRTHTNQLAWIKPIILEPGSTSAEMIRFMSGEEDIKLALGFKCCMAGPNPSISPFYHGLAKLAWGKVYDCPPENEEVIRADISSENTCVSSPQHILSRDKWRRWMDTGIVMVHHLCHPNENRIMGQGEIAHTFNIKCNFLDAFSVRQSIPFPWRSKLSAHVTGEVPPKHKLIINSKRLNVLDSEWVTSQQT